MIKCFVTQNFFIQFLKLYYEFEKKTMCQIKGRNVPLQP